MFFKQFEPLNLNLYGVRMPEIKLDDSIYKSLKIDSNINNELLLKNLCKIGFEQRVQSGQISKDNIQQYRDRFAIEFNTIKDGGFIDYFILLWDIIRFVKEKNIPKGAARGSAAGCLIFFLLGVTDVDPLRYNLYFERFLSKQRLKKTIVDNITYLDGSLVPDCDVDLGSEGREEVVEYTLNKYKGKSCKLSTYSTLTSKVLIKECGKIVGEFSEQTMNDVSGYIESVFGKVKELEESYVDNEHFRKFCNDNPETYQIAKKLHGLIKSKGSHASGYLISYDNLDKCIPIELGTNGEVVSGYDMYDAGDLAIKVDLLGLQDVSLIFRVCNAVGINLEDIDINDDFIYEHLKNLQAPYGLFQIGASCNHRVTQKVMPRNISELASVISLSRPGALAYVDQFADYVNKGESQSVHHFFDDVLQSTGQIPIFQEQSMAMTVKIGFTLDDAETLRRIIGKKKKEDMPAWEEKIKNKIKENNLDPEIGNVLWKVLNDSASYSFNASHGFSYAILSALSVYLKFKYPLDFFLESLKMAREKSDASAEINLIQSELQYFNIKLLPPDLIKSQLDFSKEGNNLRFGLTAIKGISDKTVEALKSFINSEKTNKFEVFQAAKKSKMSVGVLSALIQAGLLQSLGENRPSLVYECNLFNLLTDREKTWCLQYGEQYDYSIFAILHKAKDLLDDKGKLLFKESRMETINKAADKYREIFKMNSKYPRLAAYFFEYKLLGFSYSYKIKDIFQEYSAHKLDDISICSHVLDGDYISVAGHVVSLEERTSAKKKKYAKLIIGDSTGTQEVMIFEPKLTEFKEEGLIPDEDDVVILTLKRWNETFVIQKIKLSKDKVYLKLAEMKD